jgi:hypothetical protein
MNSREFYKSERKSSRKVAKIEDIDIIRYSKMFFILLSNINENKSSQLSKADG